MRYVTCGVYLAQCVCLCLPRVLCVVCVMVRGVCGMHLICFRNAFWIMNVT